MATRDLVPRGDQEANIGTLLKRWLKGWFVHLHALDITDGSVTATIANIVAAISAKHTAGTDQGLDTGGANAVTAAQAKSASDKAHDAVTAGTGINVTGQVVKITDTAVTPGSYMSASIVVDQQGRITSASGGGADYVKVSDRKAQNTAGGTATSGAWRTRDINTEDNDAGNVCSILANQITLAAGTYECEITAPAFYVGLHQARLQNITAGTTLILGSNAYNENGLYVVTNSRITGRFTLAVQSVLEVQHIIQYTVANQGFGKLCNFANEVYTVAVFRKTG